MSFFWGGGGGCLGLKGSKTWQIAFFEILVFLDLSPQYYIVVSKYFNFIRFSLALAFWYIVKLTLFRVFFFFFRKVALPLGIKRYIGLCHSQIQSNYLIYLIILTFCPVASFSVGFLVLFLSFTFFYIRNKKKSKILVAINFLYEE